MQTQRLLHGGDYNPEQWLDRPDILKQDLELMKKAHVNVVTLGVFSWSTLEPEEGVYQLDWLADIIHALYQNGISTILATRRCAASAPTVSGSCTAAARIIVTLLPCSGKRSVPSTSSWPAGSAVTRR